MVLFLAHVVNDRRRWRLRDTVGQIALDLEQVRIDTSELLFNYHEVCTAIRLESDIFLRAMVPFVTWVGFPVS